MPLRILQVGIGGHGKTWMTVLQRETTDGDVIRLVGVADPSPWARTVAEEDGIPATQIFTSLEEALRFVDCDVVLVVTPPATHREVVSAALLAGKDVLCEKPLAPTLADARALADLAAERGRTLMVSQNYRYNAPVRALQRMIASGEVGTPLAVELTFRKDTWRLWPEDNFRFTMAHPLLVDMSIHHLDLIRAVTGRNAASIAVESWRLPDSPFQGDAALAALIRLEGDLPVVYRGSWSGVGPQTTWNGDWRILTDRGRLIWNGWLGDADEDQILWHEFGAAPVLLRQERLRWEGLEGSLHAFVEAVTAGTTPETSAVDNLHSLAMLYAGVESADRGGSVNVSI